MNRTRTLIATLLGLALILGLAGCGNSQRRIYSPERFGENGRCYYVNDISEVRLLQDDRRCERTWTAYPMPLDWRQRYDDYYGSPDYYSKYVPTDRRSTYVRGEEEFRKVNGPGIARQRASATYTDGKRKYSGPDVAKSRSATSSGSGGLGGGSRSGGLGGGSRSSSGSRTSGRTSAGR